MEFFLVLGPQMGCPGGPVQYKVLVPNKQPPTWFTWDQNFVDFFYKSFRKLVRSMQKWSLFFKFLMGVFLFVRFFWITKCSGKMLFVHKND